MEFLVGIFEVLDTLLTLNVCFFMIRAEGIYYKTDKHVVKIIKLNIVIGWDVEFSLKLIKVSLELPLKTSVFLKLLVLSTSVILLSFPA